MPVRAAHPTTFRPSEALREAIRNYARNHTNGNLSSAICELLEAGLKTSACAHPQVAQSRHYALRRALMDLYPEWSGKANPNFGEPIRVALKGNGDPVDLILAHRQR